MKTCSKCRSAVISGTTDVDFNRNGLHIQVKSVPAQLCTQCDHKTLDGKIALYIDHIVQAIFAAKQPIRVREVVLEAA
jgi:YgiT-type zinc finger domain-containing protein